MMQQFAWTTAVAVVATTMAGCSSGIPRPEQDLARAEASIAQAEQAGGRTHAGAAFDSARDKLGEARRLADDDRNEQAQQAAREVRAGVETLRDETRRGAGAAP